MNQTGTRAAAAPAAAADPFTRDVMRHAHAVRAAQRRGDVHGVSVAIQALIGAACGGDDSQSPPGMVDAS